MLIDTHCHINLMVKKEFDVLLTPEQLDAAQDIIAQAAQADVGYIINVATSLVESKNCIALAQRYEQIFATVGIHPNDLESNWREDFSAIRRLIQDDVSKGFTSGPGRALVGLGETGIDLYRSKDTLQQQVDAFKMHIECALEHNMGIVVHSRNAQEETLRVLEEYTHDKPRAVIHCFSYGSDIAQEFIKLGFYLGIGATITYPKNNSLREVVTNVSLEHIVLETDAPFLPPQSMRGQQNAPKHIRTVAEYIAELRGISWQEVGKITTANATRLFGLSDRLG